MSPDGARVYVVTRERLAAGATDDALDTYRLTADGGLALVSDGPPGRDPEADVLILAPGRYRIVAVARDGAGNRSHTRRAAFRVGARP